MGKRRPPDPRERHLARIDRILAEEDRDLFIQSAGELDGDGGAPLGQGPEPLDMLGGLWMLHLQVSADGIWKFVAESTGEAFHETLAWCERVEAERAAAYLRAVAALFPRGRVPKDEAARRVLVDELEGTVPDPLRALDDEYAGAMDELADRVREWLGAHRLEVVAALERASAEPAPPEPAVEVEADANALMQELWRSVSEAASRRKPFAHPAVPSDAAAILARIDAFGAAIAALTPEEWLRITGEQLGKLTATHNARFQVATLQRSLAAEPGYMERFGAAAREARERAKATTASLPESVAAPDGPPGLRRAAAHLRQSAAHAVDTAVLTLEVLDVLLLQERGADSARVLLAPFRGLIPWPEGVTDRPGRKR